MSLVIGFFGFFLFNSVGFCYIIENHAEGAYDEGSNANLITNTSEQGGLIKTYIEIGGGYYLKANSDFQKILSMVELQDIEGIDFGELRGVAISAVKNMNVAIENYTLLIEKVGATPYKDNVIQSLKDFDYDSFEIENKLNCTVYKKVKGFLKNGNVSGIYIYTHGKFLDLGELLNSIKNNIDQNKVPPIEVLWNINEELSKLSLFGSYITRVFANLETQR
jgi:hypothetical protein